MFHCFYALPALVFSSNKILNGDFSEDFMYWQYYLEDDALADKKVKGSQFTASIEDGGDELWSVILHQGDLRIEYGKQYMLRFDARAEEPKFIHAIVQLNRSPWTAYNSNYEFTLGTEMATYERTFTMSSATDNAASLVFELGQSAENVVIDNVFLCELRHSAPQKDLQIQISSEGSTKLTKTPGGSVEIYDTTDGRSVSFSYINNTPVTVEALNNARYSFFRWEIEHEDASISYSYENPLNLVLDEDIVVTSYYNKKAAIEVLYAVNCGGPAYTGSDGISYEADNYYSGGYADGVSGAVPITRILWLKWRLGWREQAYPETSLIPTIGSSTNRSYARDCVRKSLVLLKNEKVNNEYALPLKKDMKIAVVGDWGHNIGYQVGGWSLDWQGTPGNDPYPGGSSILDGVRAKIGAENATHYSTWNSGITVKYDAIIVAVGEKPYAEDHGDSIKTALNLHTTQSNLLTQVNTWRNDPVNFKDGKKARLITILISGRPRVIGTSKTDGDLGKCDAFVAAWLPGTEGIGIADVLFNDVDFSGKLSMSWPKTTDQIPINAGDGQTPLFECGYGLSYAMAETGGMCDGVPAWDPNQHWTTYSLGDRRTNDNRLWECINVAYAYHEPSGPYGHYGWSEIGSCD